LSLQNPPPALLGQDLRRRYVLEFGSQSNAYFHFQEGLRQFHLPDTGFLSYHLETSWGRPVPMVFLKPLCAEADLPRLLGAFLREYGPAIFMGVDARTASVLGDLGLSVNEFGVEFTLPLQTHAVAGRGMRHLRTIRHLGTRGVEVQELTPDQVCLDEVLRLSARWLQGRRVAGRELRFLTRPPDFAEDLGVRRFYCFKDGRLVGFVFFDPYFKAGRCIGYCANILRGEPGLRPSGILDYAVLQAMDRFRAEGIQELALGISPLHDLRPCPGEDRLLRYCGKALYHWGGALYNFRELAFHKSRYRGQATKLYFCKRGLGLLAAVGLSLRATNVLRGGLAP
jgi:lysylphosphatidylglycerol synthetase-like protein (DUF2156 family)